MAPHNIFIKILEILLQSRINKKNTSKTLGLSATLQNLPVKLTNRPFFQIQRAPSLIQRLKSDWERSVFVSKSPTFCFLYEICIYYTKVMVFV